MSIAVAANPAFRTLRFEPWGCGASEPPSLDCTIDTVVDGIVDCGIASGSYDREWSVSDSAGRRRCIWRFATLIG